MAIKPPEEQERVLRDIVRMQNDRFDRLLSLFDTVQPSAHPNEMAKRLVQSLVEADISDPRETVAAIMSMIVAKNRSEMDAARFVASVARGLTKSDEDVRDQAVQRLSRLISPHGPVARSIKAHEILVEHANVYKGARVLTDVRPVYLGDEFEEVDNVVTVHTLKIDYLSNGDKQSLYVALDASDLGDLQEALDRAQRKELGLSRKLSELKIQVLQPEH